MRVCGRNELVRLLLRTHGLHLINTADSSAQCTGLFLGQTRSSTCLIIALIYFFPLLAVKTHRELFSDFYASLFGSSLEALMAEGGDPAAAKLLWQQMSRDITTGRSDPLEVRSTGHYRVQG